MNRDGTAQAGEELPPRLCFATAADWERWLAENHQTSGPVWLLIAKKGASETTVAVSDALDVALCYGWIDGQRKGHDETYFLQRYSRRRPKSTWSQINVQRVDALAAAGRMREPGLAQVEAAKADGRWDGAYPPQKRMQVPSELAEALASNRRARERFSQLKRGEQMSIIFPIVTARSEGARLARVRKAIERLEAGV